MLAVETQGFQPSRTPVPLQLAEVPLIQVWGNVPRAKAGVLPDRFWKTEREVVGSDGERYMVSIRGDAEYGLPYGSDGLYLYALLTIARDQGAWDGVIRHVSMNEIVRMVRSRFEVGGEDRKLLRAALLRMLRTSILIRRIAPLRPGVQIDLDLREPAKRPVVPDTAVALPTEMRERGIGILDFDVTQIHLSPDDVVRTFINEVQIHPLWIDVAARGWLTWIDLETYSSLPGTVARNLYALLASRASRGYFSGHQADWSAGVQDIANQIGIASGYKPSKLKGLIEDASVALEAAGVLSGHIVVPGPRRGQYRAFFKPAYRLLEVDSLRGSTMFDSDESLLAYSLLVRAGISRPNARNFAETKRNQAMLWATYMLYLEEHPDRTPRGVSSTAGFLFKAIQDDFAVDSSAHFEAWRARPMQRRIKELEGDLSHVAKGDEVLSLPAPVRPNPPTVEDADPDAVHLLEELRQAADQANLVQQEHFAAVAAVRIQGATLVITAEQNRLFSAEWIASREPIWESLRQLTDGRVTRLVVQQP